MKKFSLKLLKFSLIFFALILGYFITDPFSVLYDYNNYTNLQVRPIRDHMSTVMFDRNKKRYNYDSFIFGSSRTLAYRPEEWKKYLPEESSQYFFDSTAELLQGIHTKIKYIDTNETPINNALIILCRDYSFSEIDAYQTHLRIHHYKTIPISKFRYHMTFFKAYLSPKFFLNFYINKFLKKKKEGYSFDSINNAIIMSKLEDKIERDTSSYYKKKKEVFYKRSIQERIDKKQRIKEHHRAMLKEIKSVFEKHNTNYKIIVSPLYEEIRLHPKDKEILTSIFGNNLYDFSGKSKFTASKYNFYESSHYRPKVGAEILKMIYKDSLN